MKHLYIPALFSLTLLPHPSQFYALGSCMECSATAEVMLSAYVNTLFCALTLCSSVRPVCPIMICHGHGTVSPILHHSQLALGWVFGVNHQHEPQCSPELETCPYVQSVCCNSRIV